MGQEKFPKISHGVAKVSGPLAMVSYLLFL